MNRLLVALACVGAAAGPATAQAEQTRQTLRPGIVVTGELWFDANATLGAFRGITRTVRGAIAGADSLHARRGWIEFNAADLATGNGLRDRDMRSSLEVEKFPTIRFDLDSVSVPAGARDSAGTADSVHVELVGRMQIHGVTRALRVPSLLRRADGLVRAAGAFDLRVPDYGIGGLRKMFGMLSMDELVRIGFDVTFNTTPPGAEERE